MASRGPRRGAARGRRRGRRRDRRRRLHGVLDGALPQGARASASRCVIEQEFVAGTGQRAQRRDRGRDDRPLARARDRALRARRGPASSPGSGGKTSTRWRPSSGSGASTRGSSARASSRGADARARRVSARRSGGGRARRILGLEAPVSRGSASRAREPSVSRSAARAAQRARGSGAAVGGPARRGASGACASTRNTRVSSRVPARNRVAVTAGDARLSGGEAVLADQRVLAPAPPVARVPVSPAVRLHPRQRAADLGPARGRSAGGRGGASSTRGRSSTTTGRPTTGAFSGARARRRTTRVTASTQRSTIRPHTTPLSRESFRRHFPQLGEPEVSLSLGRSDRVDDPPDSVLRYGGDGEARLRPRIHGPRHRLDADRGPHPGASRARASRALCSTSRWSGAQAVSLSARALRRSAVAVVTGALRRVDAGGRPGLLLKALEKLGISFSR